MTVPRSAAPKTVPSPTEAPNQTSRTPRGALPPGQRPPARTVYLVPNTPLPTHPAGQTTPRRAAMRQMALVGFLQAQNCTTLPASWRHPEARTDTYSPDYYRHIAQVLEAGKF